MRDTRATLYQRGQEFIINRVDRSDARIPITGPEVHVLPLTVDDRTLGALITDVVGRSRTGVPHPMNPTDHAAVLRPLLAAARVSSWRAFMRGTLEVTIFLEGGKLLMLPSVNLGPREGFGEAGSSVTAEPGDAEAVGRAAREALSLAR